MIRLSKRAWASLGYVAGCLTAAVGVGIVLGIGVGLIVGGAVCAASCLFLPDVDES